MRQIVYFSQGSECWIPQSLYFYMVGLFILLLIPFIQVIDDPANIKNGGERPFIAGLVRLVFHDCVGTGGCDGCINHNLDANKGLEKYEANRFLKVCVKKVNQAQGNSSNYADLVLT